MDNFLASGTVDYFLSDDRLPDGSLVQIAENVADKIWMARKLNCSDRSDQEEEMEEGIDIHLDWDWRNRLFKIALARDFRFRHPADAVKILIEEEEKRLGIEEKVERIDEA